MAIIASDREKRNRLLWKKNITPLPLSDATKRTLQRKNMFVLFLLLFYNFRILKFEEKKFILYKFFSFFFLKEFALFLKNYRLKYRLTFSVIL